MAEQQPDEIIGNLLTTSDKIRALARAGYDRSEISRLLSVRYQHVRNVLLASGIGGGLRRGAEPRRDAVKSATARAPRKDASSEALLNSGFQLAGEWVLGTEAVIRLNAAAPERNGVYAFVANKTVVYVGLSNSGFRTTFDQYRRGDERQRTRARINKRIAHALSEGQKVEVLIATPEPLEWRGLPVSTAAGLEAGLIRLIRPEWNMTGRT